jgi:hypothetical protein
MSNEPKKFTLSTDTDLHFDMLADHSKLKLMPNLVDGKSNLPSFDDDKNKSDSDSDIVNNFEDEDEDDDNSESSDNSSPKFNNDNNNTSNPLGFRGGQTSPPGQNRSMLDDNRDYSQFKGDEKNNYLKQKAMFDYVKNSEKSESGRDTDYRSKEIPSMNELKNMEDVPFHMLDEQTQKFKKMEKYAELLSIKRSGITLTKDYTLHSEYDEMCFEVEYWNNYQSKRDGVELGKNFMVNAVTALEFMNEGYDPFGLKLKGWSEQMELNKESYTSVFGELYDKYRSSGKKMEPEIKLILMVSASAASFHASKKMAESLPGLDSVLQSNPELLSKLQGVINNNISNQGKKAEDSDDTQRKMYDQMQKLKEQQSKFDELKKTQDSVNNNTQMLQEQMNMMNRATPKNSSNVPVNDGRSNITSILNKIKAQNATRKADEVINNELSDASSESRVSVQSDKKDDSSVQESTEITLGSDGKPKRKKRGAKNKISIITK